MLRLSATLATGLLAGLLLSACASHKPAPGSAGDAYQARRYSHASDAAPLRVLTPEEVADAVPRADPILAAGNHSPYTVSGKTYRILDNHAGYRERGIASWYGAKFDGHETSNGEIFDVYAPSAAHRTLPIPVYARVTNLDNGRSVIVRVNDRGPFHSERLIDLSYAAAVKLGFDQRGTAPVEVEVVSIAGVDDRRDAPGGHYRYLQLGAFGSADSAQRLRSQVQAFVQVPVEISEVDVNGDILYRVRLGPVADGEQLALLQQQLRDGGYPAGQPLP
ncbi:septal ring lytic transglycosylase RlpA family protein [Mangrovimicrobium sediminis]|uniref:Endolytic peptidoglycan transglycosylase RlpA n=1 Tax=Mangrovimicrobium sediminis TaxID=2562682 RepID=A0A4Z0M4S9_9GAMM|nr:septal ring lytic transglycosylase RlpA family protein [Haliea sp. SAOS-164]